MEHNGKAHEFNVGEAFFKELFFTIGISLEGNGDIANDIALIIEVVSAAEGRVKGFVMTESIDMDGLCEEDFITVTSTDEDHGIVSGGNFEGVKTLDGLFQLMTDEVIVRVKMMFSERIAIIAEIRIDD